MLPLHELQAERTYLKDGYHRIEERRIPPKSSYRPYLGRGR